MSTTAPPPQQDQERDTAPERELISPHLQPQEISFPFPKSLHTTAHLHLTFLDTSTMVFMTTTTPGADGSGGSGAGSGSVKPMGSLVYAMPDVRSSLYIIRCMHACMQFAICNVECVLVVVLRLAILVSQTQSIQSSLHFPYFIHPLKLQILFHLFSSCPLVICFISGLYLTQPPAHLPTLHHLNNSPILTGECGIRDSRRKDPRAPLESARVRWM